LASSTIIFAITRKLDVVGLRQPCQIAEGAILIQREGITKPTAVEVILELASGGSALTREVAGGGVVGSPGRRAMLAARALGDLPRSPAHPC
jgi:hypothetical protein